MRVDIDLVRTDEHGSRSNTSVIQELVELSLGHFELLWGGSIDHIKYDVATLSISGPFASVLFLAANIPTFHIHCSLFENFHIQTNGWNGLDRDSMGQDGKKSGLSTVITIILVDSNRGSHCFEILFLCHEGRRERENLVSKGMKIASIRKRKYCHCIVWYGLRHWIQFCKPARRRTTTVHPKLLRDAPIFKSNDDNIELLRPEDLEQFGKYGSHFSKLV